MKSSRRKFLHLAAGAAALPLLSQLAPAENYPTRPITLIVPIAAGGAADTLARVIAPNMTKSLGQNVIIENVPGADGSVGTGRVARARPDGYTIGWGFLGTHVFNGGYYSLPYDVLSDFTPISPLVANPQLLLARKTLPPNDLIELIAWLKANPNKATAGRPTVPNHLLTALFRKQTGTQFTIVPYRGAAPGFQDLLAGQIDLFIAAPTASLPLVQAGNIKAFAVTADMRMAMAPDIPTFVEMGLPGLSYSEWAALFAPKGTPADIVGKLNVAAVEALANPSVRSRIADLGSEIFPREQQTPEALAAIQRADAEKWWPIIKEFGIKAE
jgi:tripartite-type tricarboxylate transporter receptor subunit TctC